MKSSVERKDLATGMSNTEAIEMNVNIAIAAAIACYQLLRRYSRDMFIITRLRFFIMINGMNT